MSKKARRRPSWKKNNVLMFPKGYKIIGRVGWPNSNGIRVKWRKIND